MELPTLPNIPGSPRWVEVAIERERLLTERLSEANAQREQWAALSVRLEARICELEADAKRLDSGRIMCLTRDELGKPMFVCYSGIDLRAAIDEARSSM